MNKLFVLFFFICSGSIAASLTVDRMQRSLSNDEHAVVQTPPVRSPKPDFTIGRQPEPLFGAAVAATHLTADYPARIFGHSPTIEIAAKDDGEAGF